jgi:amino acid adenylation domain-containing protein
MGQVDYRLTFSKPVAIKPAPGFRPFDPSDIEQSIVDRFEQQVNEHSSRIAVRTRDRELTYHALNCGSNAIARKIVNSCGNGEAPVALLLEQGAAAVTAILAVLKAGKIYVPIDPTDPTERISTILHNAQPELFVTDKAGLALLQHLAIDRQRVIRVDQLETAVADENLGLEISPDRAAYIFYTSGSTGTPKGVVDSPRNVLHNIMRYTNNLRIAPSDRLSLVQSCSFSGSVSSLFGALLNGATLFPVNLRRDGLQGLAALIDEQRLTMFHAVPSIFERLVESGGRLDSLRVIRLEGDRCAPRHVDLYRARFGPSCVLANGLGATETGLVGQYIIESQTAIPGPVVPVGYPTQDVECVILDESGAELPPGQVGQIAVRSRYLALGYWRSPALTGERFHADPKTPSVRLYHTGDLGRRHDDGCLEHLGRKDFQIRMRGRPVEAETVEAALTEFEGIAQAVVHARDDRDGQPRLVAYLVPAAGELPNASIIHQTLARRVPGYMIPSRYVTLDSLPLNSVGKVDRRALPAPDRTRPRLAEPFVAPRSENEKVVAEIWRELLGLTDIGVHDRFFELGGDSLQAVTLPLLLEKQVQVRLTDGDLLQADTVAGLAKLIERRATAGCLVPIRPDGSLTPFFCIHDQSGSIVEYHDLANLLGPEQPVYGLQSRGLGDGAPPLYRVADMAAHYIDKIKEVQANGPYLLGGNCFGGVVAFEMARLLEAQGETVALLALMDTACPVNKARPRTLLQPHLHKLLALPLREQAAYISVRVINRTRRALLRAWYHTVNRRVGDGGGDAATPGFLAKHLLDPRSAIQLASETYRPGKYKGGAVLFVVKPGANNDPGNHAGWDRLIEGELETVCFSGDVQPSGDTRVTCGPHLSALVDELNARLRRGHDLP